MLELFWQLLLPIECLACRQEGQWICQPCRNQLTITPAAICAICGKAGENGICLKCSQQTGVDGIVCLFNYRQTAIKRLVKNVKFGGQTDAARFFVRCYGNELVRRLPHPIAALAPIPLSKERHRERGFNQAQVLASELAVRIDGEIWDGLVRCRATAAQAELNREARRENVKNAFALKADSNTPESVILVDDVVTTGSTLGAAARVLRKSGCKTIWAVTIAHG